MKRNHDLGGEPGEPIVYEDHPVEPWAKLLTATIGALRARGLMTVDELRRHIEDLPADIYAQPYFERWAEAMVTLLDEKGLVPAAEIEARIEKLYDEREAAHRGTP